MSQSWLGVAAAFTLTTGCDLFAGAAGAAGTAGTTGTATVLTPHASSWQERRGVGHEPWWGGELASRVGAPVCVRGAWATTLPRAAPSRVPSRILSKWGLMVSACARPPPGPCSVSLISLSLWLYGAIKGQEGVSPSPPQAPEVPMGTRSGPTRDALSTLWTTPDGPQVLPHVLGGLAFPLHICVRSDFLHMLQTK